MPRRKPLSSSESERQVYEYEAAFWQRSARFAWTQIEKYRRKNPPAIYKLIFWQRVAKGEALKARSILERILGRFDGES